MNASGSNHADQGWVDPPPVTRQTKVWLCFGGWDRLVVPFLILLTGKACMRVDGFKMGKPPGVK